MNNMLQYVVETYSDANLEEGTKVGGCHVQHSLYGNEIGSNKETNSWIMHNYNAHRYYNTRYTITKTQTRFKKTYLSIIEHKNSK